ncbi:MAG TPA: DEAD/DEAH box helicase [Mycobacteriales bacterium]|nr:DEAD/DEAH box helicase [Mycobacteriales bacterium]
MAARDVEQRVERGQGGPPVRDRFQAVALLARAERERLRADTTLGATKKAAELKRVDGIAAILARTAAQGSSLFSLLADDAPVSDGARRLVKEMSAAAGVDGPEIAEPAPVASAVTARAERQVVPRSAISRQLANPFLEPDFSQLGARPKARLLAGWELLAPLLRAFEETTAGAPSCMALPAPGSLVAPGGRLLMPHQAQVVAAAAQGHRTFLLADEPGLGKTAQALLAAQAADAFPLLAVVPNVVKANWAREVNLWTPLRNSTVVHGDGENVDAYSDVVILNYELLDRHIGWLTTHGFRGMVVDEAHFIKNKQSQRSQHVLELADSIRLRTPRPLMMALTGTPLINDIEDFLAIWHMLGWIDDKEPRGELMQKLEEIGLTPADRGFLPAARQAVVDMGIVRRRKIDVAADIPARRIADLPVELDGAMGRSIREAEKKLVQRLVKRYDSAIAARASNEEIVGIDHDLVRRVAGWERQEAAESKSDDNVFALMRRIGQAKAGLAADYAVQLARSAGKVVFFARHIDVMDAAEEAFAAQGLRYSSIRGDQTAKARQKNVDDFVKDPDVAIVVCSLMAAGVGINLQVSSNVVLAELSWTDAEQTQAIDRVHRIGQDQPVTAWRIIAAQTIESRVAELIDSKAGLAARALDGSDEEVTSSADVQLDALISLLTEALVAR